MRTAWQDAFHILPPSRKAHYRIRDKFGTLGSVCNAPTSGRSKNGDNYLRVHRDVLVPQLSTKDNLDELYFRHDEAHPHDARTVRKYLH